MPGMEVVCPFCFKSHGTQCKEKNVTIPMRYIKALQKHDPIIFQVFIGYAMHGKTCYLSSLFYSLHETEAYTNAWDGFAFAGLTQATLQQFKDTYIKPLADGNLPPRTDTVLQEPLITEFTNIPAKRNSLSRITPRNAFANFYDIGGEAFNLTKEIVNCLPLLNLCNPLTFLIDLPMIMESTQAVSTELHSLINNIVINVYGSCNNGNRRKRDLQKDAVVCFTKADRMWGAWNEERYGPLCGRPEPRVPSIENIRDYIKELETYSDMVGDFLRSRYAQFYNVLKASFRRVRFASVSSLGCEPVRSSSDTDARLVAPVINPTGVFDPIFFAFRLNGFL
jgi:hypothetical protein